MKKIILLILLAFTLLGCEKKPDENVINSLEKKIEKTSGYELKGQLLLFDNEDNYKYSITVNYLKDDYYNVKMTNLNNNNEQIILKNDNGLYVITPSLNRSYKFDSNWPNNSSQIYILQTLMKDMKKETTKIEHDEEGYIITADVDYPNNPELKYEKILLKNNEIQNIKIYDENDSVKMELQVEKIDYKKETKKEFYNLENYIENSNCENEECKNESSASKLDNAIYPIYIPDNTYLSSSEIIDDDQDSRIILTFSGNKNYVLVEETAISSLNHETIPVYGEPVILNDTIGAISTNAIYWTSNDVSYYLASSDLTAKEMVCIASSLTNSKSVMYTK